MAQQVAPESRVVYVDDDPLVLVHAWALLTSSSEGATDYIEADAHDVGAILQGAAATLNFTRPVAIIMLGIPPFIGDDSEARAIVTRLLAAVPTGSYLAVTHSTSEVSGERVIEAVRQWNQVSPSLYRLRSPEQTVALLGGQLSGQLWLRYVLFRANPGRRAGCIGADSQACRGGIRGRNCVVSSFWFPLAASSVDLAALPRSRPAWVRC